MTEVITKFKRLLHLCPGAATTNQEKVRRLIRAFHLDIAVHVDHGIYPPANIEEFYCIALQAEYHLKNTRPLPSTQLQAGTTLGQNQNKQPQNSN